MFYPVPYSLLQSSQSSLSQPSSSSSSSVSSIGQWTIHSGSQPAGAGAARGPGLPTGATEQDKKLKQYLEDERIALFLQNEEFMRELQRNREFLIALERGTTVLQVHQHTQETGRSQHGRTEKWRFYYDFKSSLNV